ncbi:FitA-like ribbon-helix-helix domain-containing protein [Thermoflexus sp.]|mgnify:CR=1 FL=1|uniref:FitA-like ribbon-helix-helix domain-containing protein n=1 Tax=Thermoflexus sp. TaxID=1969742 RepID=UPI001759EB69|nr:Arc family DNA-binding protein [Thermoflexus sp.]
MPTLTIKNMPEDLYRRLKRRAEMHRRSLNSEIIFCLEQAVGAYRVDPEIFLVRARQLREKTRMHPLDEATLNAAKRTGRP